jgi:hypothetical protein
VTIVLSRDFERATTAFLGNKTLSSLASADCAQSKWRAAGVCGSVKQEGIGLVRKTLLWLLKAKRQSDLGAFAGIVWLSCEIIFVWEVQNAVALCGTILCIVLPLPSCLRSQSNLLHILPSRRPGIDRKAPGNHVGTGEFLTTFSVRVDILPNGFLCSHCASSRLWGMLAAPSYGTTHACQCHPRLPSVPVCARIDSIFGRRVSLGRRL